jgi:hypothetical protein
MSQRGRPRKNGVRSPKVFFRTLLGLCSYDKARLAGEKYDEGLRAARAEVLSAHPDMSISATEVKRILAANRSKTLPFTFFVTECDNFVTPNGKMSKRAWAISVVPQPNYPRHNARESRPANERA